MNNTTKLNAPVADNASPSQASVLLEIATAYVPIWCDKRRPVTRQQEKEDSNNSTGFLVNCVKMRTEARNCTECRIRSIRLRGAIYIYIYSYRSPRVYPRYKTRLDANFAGLPGDLPSLFEIAHSSLAFRCTAQKASKRDAFLSIFYVVAPPKEIYIVANP